MLRFASFLPIVLADQVRLQERFQAVFSEIQRISLDRCRPRYCTTCGLPKDEPDNPGHQVQHIWDTAAGKTSQYPSWAAPLGRMWAFEHYTDGPVRPCCKAFIEQRVDRLNKEFEALRSKHLVRSSVHQALLDLLILSSVQGVDALFP